MSRTEPLLPQLVESCLDADIEVRFGVDGLSMWPLIRPGDAVQVRRPGGEMPDLGDVVAVRGMPGGALLVHRVVRLRNGRFLLRGDNSTMANGEHLAEAVVGVVSAVEREGRLVWYGAGKWGPLVAVLVRTGSINRFNRAALLVRRLARRTPPGGSGAA